MQENRSLKSADSDGSYADDSPLVHHQYERLSFRKGDNGRRGRKEKGDDIEQAPKIESEDLTIKRIPLSKEASQRIFRSEKKAFEDMLPDLLKKPQYYGKYVVIVDGKLADSGSDEAALVMRVYRKHGYRPIYVGKVSEEKEYVEFSSPE